MPKIIKFSKNLYSKYGQYQTHELRLKALWFGIGYMGLALLVYLSVTRAPHHVLSFHGGDKIEHIAAFFVITAWWGQLHTGLLKIESKVIAVMLMAIMLELLQRQIGRYPDLEYGDIYASFIGVLLARVSLLSPLGSMLANIEKLILNKR